MMLGRRRWLTLAASMVSLSACTSDDGYNESAIPVSVMSFSTQSAAASVVATTWPRSGKFIMQVKLKPIQEVDTTDYEPSEYAGIFSLLDKEGEVLATHEFSRKLNNIVQGFSFGVIRVSSAEATAVQQARLTITEGSESLSRYYSEGEIFIKRVPFFNFLD